jgi:hypothetical protein
VERVGHPDRAGEAPVEGGAVGLGQIGGDHLEGREPTRGLLLSSQP